MTRPGHLVGARGDEGQTTLLVLGGVGLVGLAAAVTVDAGAVFLHRQHLNGVAEGAALAAADAVRSEQLYAGGLDPAAPLDPLDASAAAQDYLVAVGALDDGATTWTIDVDGADVTVTLSGRVEVPVPVPGLASTTTVGAASTATAIIR